MRFQQRDDKLPQVDLIPMLTVMMGILAFFVMVTLTLTSQKLLEMELPPKGDDAPEITPEQLRQLFLVRLDQQGQPLLNEEPIGPEQLKLRVEAYLSKNPGKTVYVVPADNLSYEEVIQFVEELREVGGDRVSLAIEE
ncbi:MAG: biopolymer transporter ExbD [Leptolyngbyaceae cyanobacterium SM1_1_3]|nr:biopolymer transporter ExbD [Leptolyngbyaceae cyanobacterium SM1_1_3]NJM84961.1 biopolymer transporter ExbD [Leptolyngbyaceae cyanobacterium RM2_2_21]NJN02882.1 biopolymer transporter ExbD [Leptolyngbyaceae cyanobacterium RM1_1_2]NJO11830.1 biopolymer transporter ExbD [Leptolyngbyaceae cyanobacterium SL_1_1]